MKWSPQEKVVCVGFHWGVQTVRNVGCGHVGTVVGKVVCKWDVIDYDLVVPQLVGA